jgi:callose synthase
MARRGRVLDNWERLVGAAQQRGHISTSKPSAGLAGAAPASLGGRAADIDRILQAANEIEEDDPNVARIRKFQVNFKLL